MKARKRGKKKAVDYSLPYKGTIGKSSDREIARRKWESKATKEEKALGSTLSMDSEGNYVRRTKLESKAEWSSSKPKEGARASALKSRTKRRRPRRGW